ncbi:Transporter of the ATP-binding cassette (ABC), partial [Coemansia helicoidea]
MPGDHAERVCEEWAREMRRHIRAHGSGSRSLVWRMVCYLRRRLAIQAVWTLTRFVFVFANPILLRRILAYMEDRTLYTREQAFWLVAGLLVGGSLASVCSSQSLWIGRRTGIQIKSIIGGEVYSKSLRRRDVAAVGGTGAARSDYDGKGAAGSVKAASLGKITNLMVVDAQKIAEAASYINWLYLLPIEIAVVVLMLYQLLGVASIGGICVILMLLPVQWRLTSAWGAYQAQLMKTSDRRVGMVGEILQGVRIIKFFAWEQRFERQVASVRDGELELLWKRFLVLSGTTLLYFTAPVLVTLTTFSVYTGVMGNRLTASVAFTALALFKALRRPMDQIPELMTFCLQAKVSVRRVEAFLAEEETPKYALVESSRSMHRALVDRSPSATYADVAGATAIGFVNASFSWRPVATGALPAELPAGSETEPLLGRLAAT